MTTGNVVLSLLFAIVMAVLFTLFVAYIFSNPEGVPTPTPTSIQELKAFMALLEPAYCQPLVLL